MPKTLFNDPFATVINSREGKLLRAKIASDEQWRFPPVDEVPGKFKKAILCFEDQYFYKHPGVNPVAIWRAFRQNLKAGKVVSGGSTLSMQVIRLHRKGKARTIYEKIIEVIWATRLELRYSKEEILNFYTAHAPFGGNTVGLGAASWRYFGRSPNELSWAEAAVLAALPNAPSLIHPGKNRSKLLQKRDFILHKLYVNGSIDSITFSLAKAELLPTRPQALPNASPHLLARVIRENGEGKNYKSTINYYVQKKVNALMERRHSYLKNAAIHNLAGLILDVEKKEVVAYFGNTNQGNLEHGEAVDIITAQRSTGSLLKPFLYASLLTHGEIMPDALIPDIPTHYRGYAPKNFDKTYAGAVSASTALSKSLNIPAVRMLKQYGLGRFKSLLNKLSLKSVDMPAGYYGLTLILGGAEATLWELANAYGSMGSVLNHYLDNNGKYNSNDLNECSYIIDNKKYEIKNNFRPAVLNAGAIWSTMEVLKDVKRPREETGWGLFDSSRDIAWKTGTSFGMRDAWAIGMDAKYVVAVWVGNADGEGRPGLTGVQVAAPIMFSLFDLLPNEKGWFEKPYDELVKKKVCKQSGWEASVNCPEPIEREVPVACVNLAPCKYHQIIHLDESKTNRVSSNCYDPDKMVHEPWFVLPPIEAWYYKKLNPSYQNIPRYYKDCVGSNNSAEITLIYPRNPAKVLVPVELDGNRGKVVFEAAHQLGSVTIYWHLDDVFLGETSEIHKMEFYAGLGKHKVTLIDAAGNSLERSFEVVE